jgi:hypothetical protein
MPHPAARHAKKAMGVVRDAAKHVTDPPLWLLLAGYQRMQRKRGMLSPRSVRRRKPCIASPSPEAEVTRAPKRRPHDLHGLIARRIGRLPEVMASRKDRGQAPKWKRSRL